MASCVMHKVVNRKCTWDKVFERFRTLSPDRLDRTRLHVMRFITNCGNLEATGKDRPYSTVEYRHYSTHK